MFIVSKTESYNPRKVAEEQKINAKKFRLIDWTKNDCHWRHITNNVTRTVKLCQSCKKKGDKCWYNKTNWENSWIYLKKIGGSEIQIVPPAETTEEINTKSNIYKTYNVQNEK